MSLNSTPEVGQISPVNQDFVPLPLAWQIWLQENIQRGCSNASMIEAMVTQGFSIKDAESGIAWVKSLESNSVLPLTVENKPTWTRKTHQNQTIKTLFSMSSPDIQLFENVLSPQECDDLVALARHKLQRSTTVNTQNGSTEIIGDRTSSGTYFQLCENEAIARIDERLAALTGHPVAHGEGLQVIQYTPGGEYKAHFDFFPPEDPGSTVHLKQGGQRVCTVVMYLNEVQAGGETHFPKLNLMIHPQKGAALKFSYGVGGSQFDARTLHAGMPVVEGVKWIASKWIRERPYI
jgi:prolyl 4-hydroxylase